MTSLSSQERTVIQTLLELNYSNHTMRALLNALLQPFRLKFIKLHPIKLRLLMRWH